jgi:hypothetical protein
VPEHWAGEKPCTSLSNAFSLESIRCSNILDTPLFLVDGTGVQVNSFKRWGDYSSMSVDPQDGCTFWYSQEYYKTTGSFNWSTRIASFKFNSCK